MLHNSHPVRARVKHENIYKKIFKIWKVSMKNIHRERYKFGGYP